MDEKTGGEEEEAAEDFQDPLEMMGGMGAEEVYKVTLIDEKAAEAEEEEVCEDFQDPLEMMGGMGQEEVYKVTWMAEEAAPKEAEKEKAPAKPVWGNRNQD